MGYRRGTHLGEHPQVHHAGRAPRGGGAVARLVAKLREGGDSGAGRRVGAVGEILQSVRVQLLPLAHALPQPIAAMHCQPPC